MTTKLLVPAITSTILDARVGTGVSNTFALPERPCLISWQTSFNIAPAVINIVLQVSVDGSSWITLDTTTAVGGELRLLFNKFAAKFLRVNVVTNTGNRQVTLTVLTKTETSNIAEGSGEFTITDVSGAALVITENFPSVWQLLKNILYYSMDIVYPVTADGSDAALDMTGIPGTIIAGFGAPVVTISDFGDVITPFNEINELHFYDKTGVRITNAQLSGKFLNIAGFAILS